MRSVDEQTSAAHRFKHGDQDALREIHQDHADAVFHFCAKSVGHDAARDVSQEVFVSAWRSRESFDPDKGSVGGWLIGIAKFKVIDHLRKHGTQTLVSQPTEPAADDNRIEQMANQVVLANAIQKLPERSQQILNLAFYSDMTHAEISAKTDTPLGTVKSDIRRGLARLRQELEGFDAASGF